MATQIPSQNNLLETIKSTIDSLEAAKQAVRDYQESVKKKKLEKDNKKFQDELKHLNDDFMSVVTFINNFDKNRKQIDSASEMMAVVLGLPEKINKRIKTINVETIDSHKINAAVYEIRRLLLTPAQINKALNDIHVADIDKKLVKYSLSLIEDACRMPALINAKMAKIKAAKIDESKINEVKEALDVLFLDNDSLAKKIEQINSDIKDLSWGIVLKFKILQYTIGALEDTATAVIRFGLKAALMKPLYDVTLIGLRSISSIVLEIANVINAVYDIKQLRGGVIGKIMGPHKRLLLLRFILKALLGLVAPLIKLGLYAVLIRPFEQNVKTYVSVIGSIVELIDMVSKLKLIRLMMSGLVIKLINGFIVALAQLTWSILVLAVIPKTILQNAKETMSIITEVFVNIKACFDVIRSFGLFELIIATIKIGLIDSAMMAITSMMIILGGISYVLKLAKPGLLLLEETLQILARIIQYVDKEFSLKLILSVNIKSRLLRSMAERLIRLVWKIVELAMIGYAATGFIPGLKIALVMFETYAAITQAISNTKAGIFFNLRVRRIIHGVRLVRIMLYSLIRLTRMRGLTKAAVRMMLILILIRAFAAVVTSLMVISAFLLMFLLVAPVVIVAIVAFGLVMLLIQKVIKLTMGVKMIAALALLSLVLMGLAIVALALVAIALLAPIIVNSFLDIILFFGLILAVVVLISAIGWVVAMMEPYLIPALYGIGIVAAMVLAVVLIALLLSWLQNIKLDTDKIKANVKEVIGTALYMLTCLFEDELDDPESKDSWFIRILKIIGGGITKIIMALAAAVILVATFVSVMCIFMIAKMLSWIQNIKLDRAKIQANVKQVIDTAQSIINLIFGEDSEKENKSNRGPLLGLIAWAMPPLGKIIDAIFTVAYLFLMVVAIVMILAIAGMLRWLQTIDLDPAKIMERVDTIFNTADAIIDRIFAPRNDKENKSSRGVLMTIISWVDEGLAKIVEAALTVVYLALILISVLLIMGIAGLLRGLQEIDLDSEKIMERVDAVFNTADAIINRIFADRDDNGQGSNRGILVTIISWVDEGLAKIVEAALGIIYLFLVLVSVGLVLAVAGLLRGLQEIDLDGDAIIEVVNTVFNTADAIIGRVMQPADDSTKEGRSVFGRIISFFSEPLAKIVDALMSIAYLGLIFLAISVIHGIAAQLNTIQNIELDANTITKKIDTIFKCASVAMQKVYSASNMMPKPPKKKGIFRSIIGFFSPGLGEILDALTEIAKLATVNAAISAIAGIAKSLKTISDLQINLDTAYSRVDQIMTIAENIAQRIFGQESKLKLPVPPKEKKSVFGALIDWAFGGESDDDRAIKAALKRVEGLGVINAAVGALGLIQENVKKIMDVDLNDFDAATQRVSNVMDMASTLSEKIFGAEIKITLPEPTQDETMAALIEMGSHWWWSNARMEAAAVDAKQQAAMKLAMQRVQALSMIASAVGSLASIIEGVDKIKDYKVPNVNTIQSQVQQIMQASNKIAFMIFHDADSANVAGLESQVTKIKANTEFMKAGASGVGTIAESLKSMIDKITPITSQIPNAEKDVKAAINLASSISFDVANLPETDSKAKFESIIEAAKRATTYCGRVQELIKSATFTEADVDNAHVRVQRGVAAIGEIITQMDSINPQQNGEHVRNNCDLIDRISSTVGSFVKVTDSDVENSKNITENYIKFFKQVDSMDIKKLQHTDYLMRSWASISRDLKGNFEGLAQTINQHIMPMLEKVNETLDKTTKCQQEIIAELTKPVDINGTGSTDVNGTVPSETGVGKGNTGDTSFAGETGRADGGNTINRNDTSQAGQKRPVVNVSKPISPDELKKGKRYTVIVEKVID